MATYAELYQLINNNDLLDKIQVAAIVAAHGIVGTQTPPANQSQREKWAVQVFSSPRSVANKLVPFVLAANKGAATAQITGAADTAIQANVDAAIDLFADLII